MDVQRRPKHLSKLQALAAIGQCRLISLWDSLFAHMRQPVSQILLTRSDIADVSASPYAAKLVTVTDTFSSGQDTSMLKAQ